MDHRHCRGGRGGGALPPVSLRGPLTDVIQWSSWLPGFPADSAQMATLYGSLDKPGPYVVLMKWYPGFMSAPHTYATDRLSVVVSGVWWSTAARRLRSSKHSACSSGVVHQTRRTDAALRWRHSRWQGARRHCAVRHWPGRLPIGRREPAGLVQGVLKEAPDARLACWRTLMIGQIRKPRAAWL